MLPAQAVHWPTILTRRSLALKQFYVSVVHFNHILCLKFDSYIYFGLSVPFSEKLLPKPSWHVSLRNEDDNLESAVTWTPIYFFVCRNGQIDGRESISKCCFDGIIHISTINFIEISRFLRKNDDLRQPEVLYRIESNKAWSLPRLHTH